MIDLHLHTTASDGRLRPSELVRQSAAAGLTVISITDHDTVGGLDEGRRSANEAGIRLVNGIEITAIERGKDVHVLGYFFDPRRRRCSSSWKASVRTASGAFARWPHGCYSSGARWTSNRSSGHCRLAEALGRPRSLTRWSVAGHATDRRDAFDRLLGDGCPAFVPRPGLRCARWWRRFAPQAASRRSRIPG